MTGATTKRRGLPLLGLVTAATMSLIALATAVVGAGTYLSATSSIDRLWHELAISLAERTAQKSLRFIEPAGPAAHAARDMIRTGQLDPSNERAVLDYLVVGLDANPNLTWLAFGRADGTYLATTRWPHDDGTVRLRRIERHMRSDGQADQAVDERDAVGTWRRVVDDVMDYDPRRRPWWKAVESRRDGTGAWIDPYIYASRLQPGVTYALPVRDASGALVGVLTADFEASPLSDFLATFEVGERGRAYIVTADGQVVGHPAHELVAVAADGEPTIYDAATHPDAMLAGAWAELQARAGSDSEAFEFGEYLAMARPFPAASGIPWLVLTVVPSDDFYGEVRQQVRRSLWVTLLVALVALVIGLLLSRMLSRNVGALREEMHRLARFEIADDGFESTRSLVREINEMGDATGVMKRGLRSFARYVPHQLVRQLVKAGGEAHLGGEEREVTVLFSDIAGFTPIVESTPVDEVLEALGEYLGRMNRAIAETDGTVCQYLGDAIMAFWGAPQRQEDHAVRACRGALHMRQAARDLLAEARASGKPELPTRFGLNSGQVMVGNIGAPERFNYAILGDPVNAASRLEGLNKVYGTDIIVGERTAWQVRDALVLRRLDWVRMKGKTRPMIVSELVGEQGQVPEPQLAAVARYEEALELYRSHDFSAAKAAFLDALELYGGVDPACEVLAARCAEYDLEPPSPEWDGVFTMTRK